MIRESKFSEQQIKEIKILPFSGESYFLLSILKKPTSMPLINNILINYDTNEYERNIIYNKWKEYLDNIISNFDFQNDYKSNIELLKECYDNEIRISGNNKKNIKKY